MFIRHGVIRFCVFLSAIFILVVGFVTAVKSPLQTNSDSPNPEAVIKYDSLSKVLTVTGNSEEIIVNKTTRCLDKKCRSKIENYTLTNSYGNTLSVLFHHYKSNTREYFKLIGLYYNSDKKIRVNKFSIKDSKNKIDILFSNKTSRLNLDYSKNSNITKVKIKEKHTRTNRTEINKDWNVELRTDNGLMSYSLNENTDNGEDSQDLDFYSCSKDEDCIYVFVGCCYNDVINKNTEDEWYNEVGECIPRPCINMPKYPICKDNQCMAASVEECLQIPDCKDNFL